MPHFISKNMFMCDVCKQDDFTITKPLVNARFPDISIIPVAHKNTQFFVRCIKRQSDFLYKVDKLTRPSDLLLIKKVLRFMADKLDVVTHNLNQTQAKHTRGMHSNHIIDSKELADLKPCFIEIGFGSGRHILNLAESNPEKIVLGFEIHTPSIRQVMNAIAINKLQNLFICNFDARLGIQALRTNEVDTIFLHFPVPWNKAKHRRVFSRDFIENSFRILKEKGHINIRSDDLEFVQDSIKEAMSADFTHFEILKNKDMQIVSKYEERWHNMQKDIYEMHIFKQGFKWQAKNDEATFTLPKLSNLQPFCNQKWVQDSIFINIGDLYLNDSSTSIAQIAFGSFYMPFNTYIAVDKIQGLCYLKKPLNINSHIKAHEFLCKILQGKLEQN